MAHVEPTGALKDLNVKLLWLTVFRAVATSLLLAATSVPLLVRPELQELSRQESLSFGVIAVVYALTLIYSLVLRKGQAGPTAAYVQVLGDVALAATLVHFTGGTESPFTFSFSLAVIAAAILLGQRGAIAAALASTIAFSLEVSLTQAGFLGPPGSIAPSRLVFLWISNTLAQFLVAVLASYLSRQLALAGGALQEREEDLAQLTQLQAQVLSAMPSGLVTGDAQGRITYVNRAARTILGLRADEPVWGTLDELFPGIRSLTAEKMRRHELTVGTQAGPRTLGLSVATLENVPGGLLIVFQDLTELRRIEGEFRRVDRLAALGTLSAQLAHEIRNPLAAMRGAAQLLAHDQPEVVTQGRLTNILVREADRLSTLVDDFLRFARPPDPQLQECDLAPLVAESVEMARLDASSNGVKLESRLQSCDAWVDPGQLKQVLLNLLRNALTAAAPSGGVRVDLSEAGGQVRIRVWDSAGAISEQNLGRIFEPFFTTREGGTGLGLSTAHSIVRAHQGQIHVRSSASAGTEFIVELPVGEARRASAGGG